MDEESPFGPRRRKLTIALVVALLHLAVGYGLLRAFAPHAIDQAAEVVFTAFNVAPPSPSPTPPPPPPSPGQGGDKGDAGKKVAIRDTEQPRRESRNPPRGGDAETSGSSTQGQGPGSSGDGDGPGAGGDGNGPGCTPRPRPVKVAGDINSTRDFPRASSELRSGQSVTVAVTVGIDGRARSCRVNRPSPDPEADRIVCRLVEERFRFEPALDARCEPVAMTYGWRQSWWDPRN